MDADLTLATRNAAAFWTALATSRGHSVLERPGFLAVEGAPIGLRAMLLTANPSPGDLAELTGLARGRADRKVVVEDSFSTVDVAGLGFSPRQLPVMVRKPGPAPASPSPPDVFRVTDRDQLAIAERIIMDGFTLAAFQPYQPGRAFPDGLLEHAGADLFVLTREGVPAGACVTFFDGTAGGAYWVTTLPEHRSHGVGRALTHAVLDHFADVPVTLSASKPGKPLYDSLGFDTLNLANWWTPTA
ncbi:GNAT family N-acetyltransferase [Amycolatopsis sp. H20-H5]|uniref:GNAT family N-acetyltransferase n=1 Tax=Amycolatopsis sp. H20-H5 TaxID=3046309 RepID=UPI002DB92ECA|nr:GNAT family N-acetyltransferase [Amycolatopsis sp. H20-H5]MEC3980891.1 GNAT family N-acetyltransferase [Amycolatopsis sp. H20-H5]